MTLKQLTSTLEIFELVSKDESKKEIFKLLKRKVHIMSNDMNEHFCSKFDFVCFLDLLPYIEKTFKFYSSKKVKLTDEMKQMLIMKYIEEFEQVANAHDDIFDNFTLQSNNLFNGSY